MSTVLRLRSTGLKKNVYHGIILFQLSEAVGLCSRKYTSFRTSAVIDVISD